MTSVALFPRPRAENSIAATIQPLSEKAHCAQTHDVHQAFDQQTVSFDPKCEAPEQRHNASRGKHLE
jgi:hypothetical protein